MGVTPLVPQTSASTSSAILAKTRRSHHTEMIADGDDTALFLAGLGGHGGCPCPGNLSPRAAAAEPGEPTALIYSAASAGILLLQFVP